MNGVPLRRFHQSYVIATSTRVDVSGVKIPEQINDAYFRKPKESKKKAQPEQFFEPEKTVRYDYSDPFDTILRQQRRFPRNGRKFNKQLMLPLLLQQRRSLCWSNTCNQPLLCRKANTPIKWSFKQIHAAKQMRKSSSVYFSQVFKTDPRFFLFSSQCRSHRSMVLWVVQA